MKWKGKDLVSIQDMMDLGINACHTKEEAREFMALLRKEQPHTAAESIGYLSGYYDHERQEQIWDWFQVAHPVFGLYHPTAEEAFAAGVALGKAGKGPT